MAIAVATLPIEEVNPMNVIQSLGTSSPVGRKSA